MMNFFETTLTSTKVRPNDLDSLGHVNNATILEYFELARWEWMEHFKLQHDGDIVPVVASIHIDYRAEILPGLIQIQTELEQSEKAFSYQVFFKQTMTQLRQDQEKITAQGRIKVAFIHRHQKSLCSVDEFLALAPKNSEREVIHA